jgi:U4/U6 small nuclear ribonucleoprotein PRP4
VAEHKNRNTKMSDVSLESERQRKLEELLLHQKQAKNIAVPTNDGQVKQRLRELKQPICLFAEQAGDRRKRLKDFLAKKAIEEASAPIPIDSLPSSFSAASSSSNNKDVKEEEFYTEGPTELLEARLFIARFSLPKAKERITGEKRKREEEQQEIERQAAKATAASSTTSPTPSSPTSPSSSSSILSDIENHWKNSIETGKTFSNELSQVGDDRPLTSCSISPDASMIVTGSFTGIVKLWNLDGGGEVIQTYKAHTERIGGVAFHPSVSSSSMDIESSSSCSANEGGGMGTVAIATGGADNFVRLWSLSSSLPLRSLPGHFDRINRVAFHPAGRHLASASFDLTWRLWDIETGSQLLEQEG